MTPKNLTITKVFTLESGIDVRQGINVGPGKFGKNNKRRALNNRKTWKVWQKFEAFVMKKPKKKNIFPIFDDK